VALASERKSPVEDRNRENRNVSATLRRRGQRKRIHLHISKRSPTQEAHTTDMQTTANKLLELLRKSIIARTQGIGRIAVAFSGGLDSSLIALIAKQAGTQVHLIHASLCDQAETEHTIQAATLLDLPIQIHEYTKKTWNKHFQPSYGPSRKLTQ